MADTSSGFFTTPNTQRDAIAQLLLAQAMGVPAGDPGSASFPEYQWPADPSDPDAPGYEGVGYTSNAPGHLADTATNPEGTLGAVLGNPNAGMPSPGYNAPSMSDLTTQAQPGDFGAAPAAQAQGQPAGLPAGFFNAGFNQPGETITGAPAQTAQAQPGGMPVGFAITGPTNNPSTAFSQNTVFGPPTSAFTTAGPSISVGDVIAGDIAGLSSLNADVNAAVNAAYGPGEVAGPVATGTPATGTPASTAVSVGYGVGLGLGDAVGGFGGTTGGFGGATGDGTSGGFGGDAGGPGVGGASTGISGGPGGTGEGGANTGEGGVSAGLSGAGEGGGAGGGAGK